MAIASNFPAIKPSLSLDFANTKRLDSRVTFTRTTTATYYDGVTTAKAEENLLTYSQEFDNAAWNKEFVTITANTLAAPDGTTTADTLAENTTNNLHRTQPAFISFTSGQTYTFSVYAKNGDRNFVQLFFPSAFSTSDYANFDISTGVLGTVGGAATASIVNVGSGWYRCIVTVTATSTASGAPSIGLITSATSIRAENYLGASKFIYIWGAQLEQRSSVTAYTATTTQAITNYIPVLLTAASGVARFDHNPTTDESLGLLIEEARTNTCLQSEDFSTTWSATRATLSTNSSVSPAGTLTADKLIATTDNDTHFVAQTFTGTAASWTFTVYAKALDYSFVALRLFNGTSQVGLAYYDLSTGATATVTAGTASIQSVGNGWYRCALTATLAASASCTADIQLASADNTNSFAGNGYSGIFLWGAQLEAGAFPTSYIATTSATVTRNADAASMTGSNFTSWYNAAEGTVYAEYQPNTTGVNLGALAISDGTLNARMIIRGMTTSSTTAFIGVSSGSTQWNDGFVTATATNTKSIFGYAVNNFAAVRNGATPVTDSVATIPVVNQLRIGSDADGTILLNGTIKKIAYYPLRVTNAQLQALTS